MASVSRNIVRFDAVPTAHEAFMQSDSTSSVHWQYMISEWY